MNNMILFLGRGVCLCKIDECKKVINTNAYISKKRDKGSPLSLLFNKSFIFEL
jgi:hypothetical protein